MKKQIFDVSKALEKTKELQKKFDDLENQIKPWNTKQFDLEIIKFRKKDPKTFTLFYDSLQNLTSLNILVSSSKLMKIAAELLNIKTYNLTSLGQQIRVDVPKDKKNILDWHQDWSYFPTCVTALTIWFPIVSMTEKIGFLDILKKSHLEGNSNSDYSPKLLSSKEPNKTKNIKKYDITGQMQINSSIEKKYKCTKVRITKGDAVFFDTCLFHRSGKNISNKIRFSCQHRLQSSVDRTFAPFRNDAVVNPFLKILS